MMAFKLQTGNENFQITPAARVWTAISLFILLIAYPGMSIGSLIAQDVSALLKSMDQTLLLLMLVVTIVFQWAIFAINYVTVYFEGTGLAGVGLTRLRLLDFAWGLSFFMAAWLSLTGLAWLLAQIGLPLPGEIEFLIPTTAVGRVVWVMVSFTAGFCEEIAFRGYLMTRLRILGRCKTWLAPILISAVAFGICHTYQGIPGFILTTVYAVLFSLLYIRTGRLWPCIIAHFMQDFGALFLPR
jgi:membrane protease YdiL (CAAX protease family)